MSKSTDIQRTKNIAENSNCLSRVTKRYRRQTGRQTTDGRTTTYSELAKKSTLSPTNFTEGNMVLKELTHSINTKMKLYILGLLMNKLGN